MKRSSVVLAAGGVCCTRMGVAARASSKQDLGGGIDHGPGSNQPVHHLRMAITRRHVQRSPAFLLRCTTQQEVRRESEEQPGVPRCDLGSCHATLAKLVA